MSRDDPMARQQPVASVEAMQRLYAEGKALKVVGRLLGVCDATVKYHLRKAGVELRRRGRPMGSTSAERELPRRMAPLPEPRSWCDQCERNLLVAEAARCRSSFCKLTAKVAK